MYDLYKDQVILQNFNEEGRLSPIILNDQHINALYLQDHTFIYLEGETLIHMTPGLYDELYSGVTVNLFAKRKKEIIKIAKWNDLWEELKENDLDSLKKDGMYFRINNLNSLLKILKEHKKELKAYIRNSNLYFMEDFEEVLLKVVSYFENL